MGYGVQTMADVGASSLSHTGNARLSVGATQQAHLSAPMQASVMQTSTMEAEDDLLALETTRPPLKVVQPPEGSPEKSTSIQPIDAYHLYRSSLGLALRFGAHWAATPFMYAGRKALMASLYFRGEQPETFTSISGNPLADEPIPLDPMALRFDGATDVGIAYGCWAPVNIASIALDLYLLRKLDELYATEQISYDSFVEQRRLILFCLKSNAAMLASTVLLVGSFLYMGTQGHSEAVGLGLLAATQAGNVGAHAVMFRRNMLLRAHKDKVEKVNGEDDSTASSVYTVQAGSFAAFAGLSTFLLVKAAFFSDSISMANDILMGATHYPWWVLGGLIALRGVANTSALIKSAKKFLVGRRELRKNQGSKIDDADAKERLTEAKGQTVAGAAGVLGSFLLIGALALSHPAVSYKAPWIKVAATSVFLFGAVPSLRVLFNREVWKNGFLNALGKLKK